MSHRGIENAAIVTMNAGREVLRGRHMGRICQLMDRAMIVLEEVMEGMYQACIYTNENADS